jgi:hypothetical protein
MEFRWIDWNIGHIAEHGVSPEEAELVVETAAPPYPEQIEDEKWIVIGRGTGAPFFAGGVPAG